MTNSKLVTYDLRAPGRNYDSLYEAIKSYPNWAHICESVWVVITTNNCDSVRTNLWKHMDGNDRLFVSALTGEAAWNNVFCDDQWIMDNL